jgi:glycine/serine hydroxymethyltransferase
LVSSTPEHDAKQISALARRLTADARVNAHWRRRECINLIPSEQPTSAYVDELTISEPAARYNEHRRAEAHDREAPDIRYYQGTDFIMEKELELKAALGTFFGCRRVEPRVISGQMANDTVFDALKQFRSGQDQGRQLNLIRRALVHDLIKGGHLSAQPMGALKNYLARLPRTNRPAVEHFPSRKDNPYCIDVEETTRLISTSRPGLIVFGRSVIIQKEPVREIAQFVHGEFGADNPERPLIMYDAAHVLGLLGPCFQDPLDEGADIVTGSTHKTFFGPQRGVILSNIAPGSAFEPLWRQIEMRTFPGHVSNHHLGTMLGLLGATYEMIRFRDEYPEQVTRNAKAFARALRERGMTVEGNPDLGFTETHQVLLRLRPGEGGSAAALLEANNVITNSQALHDDPGFAAASGLRMGTQEMTRYGMKEDDFRELAVLIAEICADGSGGPADSWREAVKALRGRFTEMWYCF